MRQSSCWVYQVFSTTPELSEVQVYIDGDYTLLRVKDQITNNGNIFNIVGYYNPNDLTQNETTIGFNDGWTIKLSPVINGVIPIADDDWRSTIETPKFLQADYKAELSWSTLLTNITRGSFPYSFNAYYSIENFNDIQAGMLDEECYLIDNVGNIFQLKSFDINSQYVTLTNVLEEDNPPLAEKLSYFYKTKNNAPILSQVSLLWLDQTARDKVQNIEKTIIWQNRGLQININDKTYFNVTKLDITGMDVLECGHPGWNGGQCLTIDNTASIKTADYGSF